MTSSSKGNRSKILGTINPPMPLAVSAMTFRWHEDGLVDERHNVGGEVVEQIDGVPRGRVLRRAPDRHRRVSPRRRLDLDETALDAHRASAGEAQLDAVVLSRVVRRGQHDSRCVELARREVEQVGGRQTEVHDIDTLRAHTVGERRGES